MSLRALRVIACIACHCVHCVSLRALVIACDGRRVLPAVIRIERWTRQGRRGGGTQTRLWNANGGIEHESKRPWTAWKRWRPVTANFLFGTGGEAGFGWYGWFSAWSGGSPRRGTLFYTLSRLDQLHQPSLHGPSIKIVFARGRGRGARGAHATDRGTKRLAYFFGPMA